MQRDYHLHTLNQITPSYHKRLYHEMNLVIFYTYPISVSKLFFFVCNFVAFGMGNMMVWPVATFFAKYDGVACFRSYWNPWKTCILASPKSDFLLWEEPKTNEATSGILVTDFWGVLEYNACEMASGFTSIQVLWRIHKGASVTPATPESSTRVKKFDPYN